MKTASKRKPERQQRAEESEGHHSYVICGPSHGNGMVSYLVLVSLGGRLTFSLVCP